jgi:nucleotide-binding universal stress UspA family protein
MKTIVIATDFSAAAKNAADYAAQFSKDTGALLVLFHCWTIPLLSSESFAVPITVNDLENVAAHSLREEAQRLQKAWGIMPEQKHKAGFAAEEIVTCAEENKAEMVIMGMSHRAKIERVFGSVATSFLHQNKFPALIVPEHVAYKRPKVLLFATDLQTKKDWKEFDLLSELASHFLAGIHILNAVQEEHLAEVNQSRSGIKLEQRLKDVPHFWHFPMDGDVVHAISKTAKEISADWIAVVPHQLPWFRQLFHHSVSSEIAFNSDYAVLALPEG